MWTRPWIYVALPDQEIEYFQMRSPEKDEPRRRRWLVQVCVCGC